MAQKNVRALLDDADFFYDIGKYDQALKNYMAYEEVKANDLDVKTRMGACYYYIGNTTESLRFLNYVTQNSKNPLPITYLYLGKSSQADLQYKDAIRHYKEYLRLLKANAPERTSVKEDIRHCAAGMHTKDFGSAVFVQNMGEKVNSTGDDFAPILSPNTDDKIYFASCRDGNLGGLRNSEGLKDERGGSYSSDMYSAEVENGEWGNVQTMSYLLNSPRYDIVLGFTNEGQVLYYFKGFSGTNGQIMVDTFKADADKSLYAIPFKSPMVSADGDGTPCFFKDTLMLFSSARAGGYGGRDLYVTTLRQGAWTEPQNLGPNINTPFDETTPFLAADGRTLYFSSNNMKSIGGLDIFKSKFDDENLTWNIAENLGTPINSAGNDLDFKINTEGSKAFFSSQRKDGYGQKDIYSVVFRTPLPEQSRNSSPSDFTAVRAKIKKENTIETVANNQSEITNLTIAPLLFEKDDNLLTPSNTRVIDPIIATMKRYPQIKLMLTSHSEENGTSEFDLYLSVKRLEKTADYLIKNGIPASNIIIQGCGSSYPIALNIMDGKPNTSGQKLNRRVVLKLNKIDKLPITIKEESPIVSEFMTSKEGERFDKACKGLSYRVQITAIKQIYSGDIVRLYPDVLIERFSDKGLYQYTIGLFNTYTAAEQLKKELESKGIPAPTIVPYVNGFRIANDDLKTYTSMYGDLQIYLKKSEKK